MKTRRNNLFIKMVAGLLSLIIVCTSLPLNLRAAETVFEQTDIETETETPPYFVEELIELRTENSKTFLRSDGNKVIVVSPEDLHYYDAFQDEYLDIDNTLVEGVDTLTNQASNFNVNLPKTLDNNKEVSVENDGYKISFKLKNDVRTARPAKREARKAAISKELSERSETELIDKKNLESQTKYSNVLTNTDIEYKIVGNSLKENIILNKKPISAIIYQYELSIEGLSFVFNENNTIYFYPEDEVIETEPLFIMPAPFMKDSEKMSPYSYDIDVSFEEENGKYVLTYIPSYEWLTSEERVYPVTIDPTIDYKAAVADIYASPNGTIYGTSNELMVGYGSGGVYDSYLKINTPTEIPADSTIVNASVVVDVVSLDTTQHYTFGVACRQVTSSWSETTKSRPSVASEYVDLNRLKRSTATYGMEVSFDITKLMQGWHDGSIANYGVNLYPLTGDSAGYFYFGSRQYSGDTTVRPNFIIEYVSNTNLQTSKRTIEAGRAGTIQIDDYSGQLVIDRKDMGYDGNILPVDISMNYSSISRDKTKYGSGYHFSYDQKIEIHKWNVNVPIYYRYIDYNGQSIYLKKDDETSKKYEDEYGLGFKYELTDYLPSENRYIGILTDSSGQKYYFNKSTGEVVKIEDNSPQKSSINISANEITDGAGRKYKLNYTNGLLTSIVYYGIGESVVSTTTYQYNTNQMLTRVTYQDGKYVTYEYYNVNNKLLKKITNTDGVSYDFEYLSYPSNSTTKAKISRIKILGSDGTVVQNVSMTYLSNTTKYTDNITNDVEILQFDTSGNLINVHDGKGNAAISKYEASSNSDAPSAPRYGQMVI